MYNKIRYEMTDPALREALSSLEEARNHFDNADADRLDAAIYDLAAAELHLRATLRRARAGIPVYLEGEPNAEPFIPGAYPTPQLKQLKKSDRA